MRLRDHCCVPRCVETGSSSLPLHGFPHPKKYPDLFRSWLYALGGDILRFNNDFIYKNYKVCHSHFERRFLCRYNRISKIAVPTVNVPGSLSIQQFLPSAVLRSTGRKTAIEKTSGTPSTSEDTCIFQNPRDASAHVEDAGADDPLQEHQHLRFNPLKNEWILVSPHRCRRPWSGQTEQTSEEEPADLENPLRAGAVRANGQRNPNYTSTYVFPNDFPALLERVPDPPTSEDPLFQTAPAKGTCRVMCFHPDSKMTVPLMSVDEILAVITEWINQLTELGRRYTWVQIFENKGAVMGCSNPHPHCQIWASSFLPNEPRIKDQCQMEYYTKHRMPLLVDYMEREIKRQERIIIQNTEWVALVPYWATWPYEAMLLPVNGRPQRMTDLREGQRRALAEIMKLLTTKYDDLFKCSFPYSMGWHGAPTGPSWKPGDSPHWLFHGIYLPPLLRSATVKKFMVGYEMLAQQQRDLTPEQAAARLRECDHISHYTEKTVLD